MLSDDPDLFVVGDPNQSVYGFNGADPTLLDRLPEILRGTKVIRLDENHRCTPQVVAVATEVLRDAGGAAASEVVPPRSSRVDGPVPRVVSHATDEDEATWAARQVKLSRAPGRPWSSIAVLTRTNAQLTKVLAAMEAAGVPAAVAGADLGPASDLRGEGSHRGARAGVARVAPRAAPGAASGGGRGVDLDDDEVAEPVPRDHVVLSTFHRAKGLQWQTVLVLGLSGGLMPLASAQTPAAVEEERRLLYVALTRSEDELWCSWFERSSSERGEVERGPSPWLAPIERAIEELDKEAAPVAASEVSSRVAELRRRLAEGVEGTTDLPSEDEESGSPPCLTD